MIYETVAMSCIVYSTEQMVNVWEKYFHLKQWIFNAFAKYDIWERITESFAKVSRVGSAVQKKLTCGKLLADMLRDGQHENTNTLYRTWRQPRNNSFLYRGEAGSWYWGVGVLVCFQELVPNAISWPWTNGWGTFQGSQLISWPSTYGWGTFQVANSILDRQLTDEAHFRVAK